MTDETTEAETTEETATKGRPRPAVTVELDAKVLEAITAAGADGITKEALAVATETPENKVYLALYRLRTSEQVHKVRAGRTSVWHVGKAPEKPATDEVTTEAPAEV